jgi:hypothetical protein
MHVNIIKCHAITLHIYLAFLHIHTYSLTECHVKEIKTFAEIKATTTTTASNNKNNGGVDGIAATSRES